MDNHLSERRVVAILLITFTAYALFALSTDIGSLGLASARHPERWALWRYIVVGFWLSVAYLIFVLRKKSAFEKSFLFGVAVAGMLSLPLASMWAIDATRFAILGSMAAYSMIAGALCLTIERPVWVGILAAVLVIVQVAVDIVVLGIAGAFRIH